MKSTLLDKSFRILEKIALSREPVTLTELVTLLMVEALAMVSKVPLPLAVTLP